MKREEAGRGLGQQATARGQCEAGGGRPSGRDRQSPHMGSRRSRPAPLGPGASAAAGSLSAKCQSLGSSVPGKMSPQGCSRKRSRRRGILSFSKDSAGGQGARSTQHSCIHKHTHSNHVLAFLNICKVGHDTCPQE